jgi:His-Xaa-Ser system protein HxsD
MEAFHGQEEANRSQSDPGKLAPGIRPSTQVDPRAWTIDGARIALELDRSIYSLQAVLRAGYKFTTRCYVFMSPGDDEKVLVVVLAVKDKAADVRVLVGDFVNELLDQRLRDCLEERFGTVRALIVAEAFAEGNLLDQSRDEGDYQSDPHGIAGRR